MQIGLLQEIQAVDNALRKNTLGGHGVCACLFTLEIVTTFYVRNGFFGNACEVMRSNYFLSFTIDK